MSKPFLEKIALVGIGLIGSSLARVICREGLAGHIAIATRSAEALRRAEELKLGDGYTSNAREAVRGADLIIVSVPVGVSGTVAEEIAPALEPAPVVDLLDEVGKVFGYVLESLEVHIG